MKKPRVKKSSTTVPYNYQLKINMGMEMGIVYVRLWVRVHNHVLVHFRVLKIVSLKVLSSEHYVRWAEIDVDQQVLL
jgi:hypothetical protein